MTNTRAQAPTERLQDSPASPAQTTRWRLVIVGEEGSSWHALPQTGSVTVGRGEDAEVRLDDAAASRRHATLHLGERVTLQDLGGPNGTRVRGRRLDKHETVELCTGDTIELGKTLAILQPDELADRKRPWTLITHAQFVLQVGRATPPFAVLRLQVVAPPGVVQDVLSAELSPADVVASFGSGHFEVLVNNTKAEQGQALLETLSVKLVAAGARVRGGAAAAPRDGTTAEALLATCSRPAAAPSPGFVVRDDAMAAVTRLVDRIAPSNINVLLLGETGSGKEVLANQLHKRSKRGTGPFVAINCATFVPTLIESQLFGHVKGSFTDAIADKVGQLAAANGGTVFLDEIGELPHELQPKLLRVLEERQVQRMGANKGEPIDVRFIFATNRDLEAEVARGAFRSDLYYRINGFSMAIPPLRERIGDIEALATAFAADFAAREDRDPPVFSPEAMALLQAYPWPGNVRELRNVIESAVQLSSGGPLTVEEVSSALPVNKAAAAALAESAVPRTTMAAARDAAEKRATLDALKAAGTATAAAGILGVSRRTVVTRLKKYGMSKPRKKSI
jgi:two-component system, NtrC family, response regulator AtoC